MTSRAPPPEAPPGLRRAPARHPVGPAGRRAPGCRARRSSASSSAPRASPSGRAMRDLQVAGLVERRAGSGHLREGGPRPRPGLSFGLLIPDLGETEIFEPICQGMMASPLARAARAALGQPERRRQLEGGSRLAAVPAVHRPPRVRRVLRAARADAAPGRRQPADRRGARRGAHSGRAARPPRAALPAPRPSRSRGHRQPPRRLRRSPSTCCASGSRRIAFVALPHAAATVDAREAGYREALYAGGLPDRPRADRAARSGRRRRGARASWSSRSPTPSSAPTIAPRRA